MNDEKPEGVKKSEKKDPCYDERRRRKYMGGDNGAVYGIAFIGAAIYYIQHATTFWEGVLGVIKAIFWPGVLIYKVLEYLKM